ncbi:WxL domain-containing protein [Vagococcus xieshaowenii]|nr:WxL domain-containing protein [Vagococcus xieshaowenii]
MKKKRLTIMLVSTLGLSQSPLMLAAEATSKIDTKPATSQAGVDFDKIYEVIEPIDPEEGGTVTPLDPENPEEELAGTDNKGPITIDFASNLYFGAQEITTTDQTYYAAAQLLRTEDGQTKFVNNYVQVTDARGWVDGKWSLSVTQDAGFKTADESSFLPGTKITLQNLKMTTNGSETDAPNLATPTIAATEKSPAKYVITPGDTTPIVEGDTGQGMGTWFVNLGETLMANDGTHGDFDAEMTQLSKDVQLMVPGKANKLKEARYATTLTWSLTDTPGTEQVPEVELELSVDNPEPKRLSTVTVSPNKEVVSYAISGQTSSQTTIDQETGVLTLGLNELVGTVITITATDADGLTAETSVTVQPFETNDIINQAGIDWKIMKDSNNVVLMVTDEIQKEVQFNPKNGDGNDYTGSTLEREMQAFYEERIAGSDLGTFVSGVDLPHEETSATDTTEVTTINGNNTPTAFALSTADVLTTWENDADSIAKYNGKAAPWWLRSPMTTSSGACDVNASGSVGANTVTTEYGLRPALYLNLVSDIEQ